MYKYSYPVFFPFLNCNCSIILKERKFFLYLKTNFRLFILALLDPFSTFVYKPILIKSYMNTNNIKTQFFHLMKYDLIGH